MGIFIWWFPYRGVSCATIRLQYYEGECYNVCSFVLSSNSALIQYPFLHAGSDRKFDGGKL